MVDMVGRVLTLLIGVVSLLAATRGSAPVSKEYRDRAEYDLLQSIQSNPNPTQRLMLLHRWQERYPNSAFRQERFYLLLTAQQSLGRSQEMLRTASAMAADDPLGLGNYWLCLITVQLRENSPAVLGRVEHSARSLLRNQNAMFTLAHKPEAVSTAEWNQQRERSTALAHRALGWVAFSREQWRQAEQEFVQVLQWDSQDAEASYWLGSSILGRQQPARIPVALYHYARSLAVSGPEALSQEAQGQVRKAFEYAYSQCYPGGKGAAQLRRQTEAGPFPPARGEAVLPPCRQNDGPYHTPGR